MPSVSTSTSTEESGGLWGQLLSTVSKNQTSASKTVILLGDRSVGKTTLLTRLNGEDIAPNAKLTVGTALDYSFLDVTSDEDAEDVIARLNVWQLEGDENIGKGLLGLALNSNTIEDSIAIIALDFSQPWELVNSLKKWLDVLEKHIDSLKLRDIDELRHAQVSRWQKYREPDPTSGKKRHKQVVLYKKGEKGEAPTEQNLVPLPNEVLVHNLGIPIIFVCTKSDYTEQLQKDFDFKDGRLDYIQCYLRKIALNYGASLIYLSAKKDQQGVDKLREHIEDICFGFGFDHGPQLLEKDAIFVPSGWDTLDKIMIDFKSQKIANDFEQPYEDFIKIPPNLLRQETEATITLTAQEDQEFLSKYLSLIEKEDKEAEGSAQKEDGMIKSLRKIGKEEDVIPSSPLQKDPLSLGSLSKPSTPSISTSAAALLQTPPRRIFSEPVQASPKTPMQDSASLANFFNNLLSKGTSKKSDSAKKPSRQEVEKELQKLRGATAQPPPQ